MGVMTSYKLKNRYMACKNTWTKDFDNVFFFGGDSHDDNLIRLKGVGEDYNSAFMKQQDGLKYMFEKNNEFDWFSMNGCDHILFKKNVIEALKDYDRNEDLLFGEVYKTMVIDGTETVIFAGGGSFFVSNSLMRKMYPIINEFNLLWKRVTSEVPTNVSYAYADVSMAFMAKRYFNIDATHMSGMFSQHPSFYDISKNFGNYLSDDDILRLKNPISFHYIKPHEMGDVYNKYKSTTGVNKYVFYHIFLNDKIDIIVEDQLDKLIKSGLLEQSELRVTIMDNNNGKYKLNEKNLEIINKYAKDIYYENRKLYEQSTLKKLYDHALQHDGNYLYMHTKGSSRVNDPDNNNAHFGPYTGKYSYKNVQNWRNIMEHFNIDHWKKCNIYLNNGYDLVGCNYMKLNHLGQGPLAHYSGNFWWANFDFIKKLPDPLSMGIDRFNAEFWVGKIKHRAMCLYPLPEKIEEHNRCLVYTDPDRYLNNIIKKEYRN